MMPMFVAIGSFVLIGATCIYFASIFNQNVR